MSSRDRIRAALAHETPDKVPVDFGGFTSTSMHVSCVEALRDRFGLERKLVKLWEPFQTLGWIDDDLLDVMGSDVCGIFPRCGAYGFPNENWKELKMPWGQTVLVAERYNVTVDANGDYLLHPQGDLSVPPSGRMAASSFFFDPIARKIGVDEDHLDPADNVEEFTHVSEEDLRHLKSEIQRTASSGRAIVASLPGASFGDLPLVPGAALKHPKGIRDMTEWLIATVERQDYVHEVFSRQCEVALANVERIYDAVGNAFDVVSVSGTDFGTQTSSFCSPHAYDSLYAPYFRKINDWIHANTNWKTFMHSCGAVEPFMSRFKEAGFDVVNPLQFSAAGMDLDRLKRRYGRTLVFWGGGADVQRTLPLGSPTDVRDEVLRNCEILAKEGGFVFSCTHNLQPNTPVDNIVAMLDAVREFNG